MQEYQGDPGEVGLDCLLSFLYLKAFQSKLYLSANGNPSFLSNRFHIFYYRFFNPEAHLSFLFVCHYITPHINYM